MSETETYYVIMQIGKYVSDVGTGDTSKYLKYAYLWADRDEADWWISVMARNWDPLYEVKTVRMTVEDDNG